MKRIFSFIIVLILLTSCAILNNSSYNSPKLIIPWAIDFTPYASKNFLFTPEKYDGSYLGIGLVNVILYPEVKDTREEHKDDYGNKWETGDIEVGSVTSSEAVEEIYKLARRMGADAVIRLEIKDITQTIGLKTFHGIEISGFAIKRDIK